jgi:drug/metabolite transporter (DMT)-like permease
MMSAIGAPLFDFGLRETVPPCQTFHAWGHAALTVTDTRETVAHDKGIEMRKDRLDGFGALVLLGITLLLAVNQIIIKDVNSGLQPVFFAGLRSVLALGFVTLWLVWQRRPPRRLRADLGPGLLIGIVFAGEFLFLFLALDLTTVGRASVIFYSMPVWFAIMSHFGLPGQRITPLKGAGLLVSFAGTAWAILGGAPAGAPGSLLGDLCALGAALGWAATAFLARATRLREAGPEMQLWWMVLVSGPLLLLVAPAFGPLLREVEPLHWVGLIFQASVVVAGGFIGWLWLLSVYPPPTVASFSFLTPVFAISLGHLVFDEPVSISLVGAAVLVAAGIVLINRRV